MCRIFFVLLLVFLVACGRQDDFYTVTKTIHIQDSVTVNQPFEFMLVLKNDSLSEAKLTIDEKVQQSLSFSMFFRCDEELLRTEVANPSSKEHNYKVHYLMSGDSLAYKFKANLIATSNDSLALKIEGYERIYKLKKPKCNEFKLNFGGMWLPGDFIPFDAMEGYNFSKVIILKE